MKGKSTLKKLGLFGIVIFFIATLLTSSVIKNSVSVVTNKDGATTTVVLKKNDGTIVKLDNVQLNRPIINSGDTYAVEGEAIVKKAVTHLGTKYDNSSWNQPTASGGLDCTGLIHLALRELNVKSVNGLLCRSNYYHTDGDQHWLPRSPEDWMSYATGPKFLTEVGTYGIVGDNIEFHKPNAAGQSIYDNGRDLHIRMIGGDANNRNSGPRGRLDVLKVNDPISNELRWYNYYDENGNLRDLPMGTIVVSYAGWPMGGNFQVAKSAHGWICIGNLETSDPAVAANKLVEMGIITASQKGYVQQSSTTSTYWLVESAGGVGVRISNYDPNLMSASGEKGVGTIWAYQIGSDTPPETTNYNVDIAKVDADTGDYVSGVQLRAKLRFNSAKDADTAWTPVTSGTEPVSLVTERTIDNTTPDIYVFEEVNANTAGYETQGGGYGLRVDKKLDTSSNPRKYIIDKLYYYSGIYNTSSYVEANITEEGKYWILRSRELKPDADATDAEKKDAIAYINYSKKGTPTITYVSVNKKLQGQYKLSVTKKTQGDSSNSRILAGAKFEVKQYINCSSYSTLPSTVSSYGRNTNSTTDIVTTEADHATAVTFKQRDRNNNVITEGGSDKYDQYVNIFNNTVTDVYTINETQAPAGTYIDWDRGPVTLVVSKKISGSRYVIDKVKLITGDKSVEKTVPETGSVQIKIDKNGNETDKDDECAIVVNCGGIVIDVSWMNPIETSGEYRLQVKKVDAKTQSAMSGVTFKVDGVSKETGTTGIAEYDAITVNRQNVNTVDTHTIEEVSLGTANADKYYKLDETITIEVKKEYNSSTKKYLITGVRFPGDTQFQKTINKTVKDVSNRDVPITVSVNDNTNTITIKADNNPTTPSKFYITKTSLEDGTALNDTEFKVERYIVDNYTDISPTTSTTVLDGKLSTKANGLIDTVEPMEGDPKAYVYEIHEKKAQDGYLNIFKKMVNGSEVELAYVRVVVRNDSSDKLVTSYEVVRTNQCSDAEYRKIVSKVDAPVVNQDARSVTLKIKDPGTTVDFDFTKYSYNNGRTLKGGTYKIEFDNVVEDSIPISSIGAQLITKDNLTVGDHTIRFYELAPPTGYDNVFDQFSGVDGIRVDFTVNYDGSITIKEVSSGNKTYRFTPESQSHVENKQDIEEISKYVFVYEENGTIYFAIKDPTHFDFQLYKKQYTGKSDIAEEDIFNETANFTVSETSPKAESKFNGALPTNTQTTFFTENNVQANSTYTYEVTETDVSSGFYRNLVGKKIKVTVTVDANGKVYDESTGKTFYKIYNSDETEVTGNAKKELDTFIKLDVVNNKVNLYIANMPMNYYQVRICKVDEDGKPYKRSATFSSTMSTTTSSATKVRDNITTNPNTGIAAITDGNEEVERGATHTYSITETKAPAGCVLLDGRVELKVALNSSTTGNVIQSATVDYYNAAGTKTVLSGLNVEYNQGGSATPLVTVYIPNEGRDFEFELKKVDSMGNLIKASTNSTGEYDGCEFYVSRGDLRANSEVVVPESEREEYARMAQEIDAEIRNGGTFSGLLEDGTYTDKVPFGEYLIYTYYVREGSAKKGYGNELEGKQVILNIYTKKENNKPVIDKVTFSIIDTNNQGADVTEQYSKYVSTVINGDKTKVDLVLTNPNAYKVRVNKVDLAGNPVTSAQIEAKKDDTTYLIMNDLQYGYLPHESSKTSDYVGISKGEEQVWRIYETQVGYPYYNIFGTDKYVEVKVKMDNSGVIKVTGYTVRGNDGREYATLKQYIEQVAIVEENGDKIVNVTIKNPSGYELKITKYEGDGTTELSGAVVKLDGTEVISGGSAHYENDYMAGISTSKTFTITEQSTVGNHVNVLAGKEIKLTVDTDTKGEITRSYKIMSGSTEVAPSDKVYNYVSVSDVKIVNGKAVIEVKILNPLVGKYNVKLYKVDENGNLIKNYNATFQGFRNSNGRMSIQNINATTSNGVATIDSNAQINDVNDSYTYQLNETAAPLGYEKLTSTIVLDTYFKDTGDALTIDETRTKLKVGRDVIPISSSPNQFVDGNTEAWYIDNSGSTVTINIYIKNTKKKFDLALRKYITRVENSNKSETPNPGRAPNLNTDSLIHWRRNHTAGYYHTKQAYKVEAGDIVTYRIYVYNEGNVKGYATEITDYLESGLEYIDNQFNRNNGWTATVNSDGTTTVVTNKLEHSILNEFGLPEYLSDGEGSGVWFRYVEIQCKVTRPASNVKSYITDRAEITKDKAVEITSTGDEVEVELDDIDSQPGNVKTYHEKDMLNYDSTKSYSTNEYYPGYQDDDDKETVYIEKFDYDFVLSKTDGEEEISGARFVIEELMDNNTYSQIYSGQVNKNKTISEPAARGDSTVVLQKTYTYKITETATKDSNYENLLAGKYVLVKTYMERGYDANSVEMYKGEYNGSLNSYFGRYGFEIHNASDGSLISNNGDLGYLYDEIKVEINNNVYPPQVKLVIPNERLYFGNYKINFKKIDSSTKNVIAGIPFWINEYHSQTDENGMINVSKFNDDAESDGTVNINKDNVDTIDRYTIEEDYEYSSQDEHGEEVPCSIYVRLKYNISLELSKSLDLTNEKYYVSNVKVRYNANDSIDIPLENSRSSATRTISLDTISDESVTGTITVSPNGTISIVAENNKIKGDYKLKLYKVDENNTAVSGIKFTVTGESSDLVTDSDGYTRVITKQITAENVNTPDEYTITEAVDSQGRVVRIKNPIKLTVKKKNVVSKYAVDTIKLTELNTGVESIESSARTELPTVEIDDNSGRTVKVEATADSDGNILIKFEDPPVEDYINIKIKKINSVTGEALNGITFKAKINNAITNEVTTGTIGSEQGVAYLDRNRAVTQEGSIQYRITETDIPSGMRDLIKLTDYGWDLRVRIKYDTTKHKHVIDMERTSISVVETGYNEYDLAKRARQREIAEEALNGLSLSSDGATLTLTVENESVIDYGISIRKADMETNAELADAKFTIKEDGRTIALDKTIAEFANNLANRTGMFVNTTHRYEIYETSPADGYQNILEKTYIELIVSIDGSGNATATYTIKPQQDYSSADVAEVNTMIQAYVSAHSSIPSFLEKDGNNFKLNIPNPKGTVDVPVKLLKHQFGDTTKGVNGAVFDIRRLAMNNASVQDVTDAFDAGTDVDTLPSITTSKNRLEETIDNQEIKIGDTYYYEITESSVPRNFVSRFYKAIVKVTVNENKTVRSSIIAVKRSSLLAWSEYGTQTDDGDFLTVTTNESPVKVQWANQLSYLLNLQKLSFDYAIPKGLDGKTNWQAMSLIGGATFKVQELTPVEGTPQTITVSDFGYQDYKRGINTDTTYTYKFTEIEPPAGYYDTFRDLEITLQVRINSNGDITSAEATVDVAQGATVSDEDLAFARKCVGAEVNTNSRTVYLRVANQKIHDTYNIRVCKVSDQRDTQGNPIPIKDVQFTVKNSAQLIVGQGYTDEEGYLTVAGLEPEGYRAMYTIAEGNTPDGVVALQDPIILYIDTTGISPTATAAEIAEFLQTKVDRDEDGIPESDRLEVVYNGPDAPTGLKVEAVGTDVVVTVPNESETYLFSMYKYDTIHGLINSSDGTPGATFNVTYVNENDEIFNGILNNGYTNDYRICAPNKTYNYTIKEIDSKVGYANVLKGYELQLHLRTEEHGLVVDCVDSTHDNLELFSYFELVPISGQTQNYSVDEILDNQWVKVNVSREVRFSSITLDIYNPYEYKMQLNKLDKNGSTPLSKAKIVAERIDDVDAERLYYDYTQNKEQILKAIVDSTDVGETLILNRRPTEISDSYLIDNNVGMTPKAASAHLWRIRETEVDAPYKNILGNNTIIVDTFYREYAMHAAEHYELNENDEAVSVKYYVADEDGNNVTSQYLDYIDVTVEKVDGEWVVSVTIKDPMIIRVGVYKKVNSEVDEPLPGANLTVSFAGETRTVENGAYESELIEAEFPEGESLTACFEETSTVSGYTNILKDKKLYIVFHSFNSEIFVVHRQLVGQNGPISGDEAQEVFKHISLRCTKTEEGYSEYRLYIENPTTVKVDVKKLDLDGEPLNGTEIRINSSHSGMHILDEASEFDFIEEDVQEHEIITYTITEVHTAEGAYVNKFSEPIIITATVEGGEFKILRKQKQSTVPGGAVTREDFDTLEYANIYIDPADKEDLQDGDMQTLTVELENPPEIEVQLTKITAGRYQRIVTDTKFTIVSQDSHTALTDGRGRINYLEEIHEPGTYTIRVYEDEVSSPKYVNILENKYMQFDITVAADGTITYDSSTRKFFNKDNDSYYDNDVEITGEEASNLAQYCFVNINNNPDISRVEVTISDPVKVDLKLVKKASDGEKIEGAEFKIEAPRGIFETLQTTTNSDGEIIKNVELVRPGFHEIEFTEITPAGDQYDNILGDNKIVIYPRIEENGEISALYADYGGASFGRDVPLNQRYVIKQTNGAPVDAEVEALIRDFVKISVKNNTDGPDEIVVTVENPVQTKMNLIKRQYTSDGESEEVLADTRFTVIKNNEENLLSNEIINEEVEIEEHYLRRQNSYYDIFENYTNTDGAYVNVLQGKFVRVYTELKADGELIITDKTGAASPNYFEIYETQHHGPATLVDRNIYSGLYSYINVWAEPNSDGIYVLNVKVLNPITMKIGVLKKQYGEGAQTIPDVSFRITSQNTGDHDITSTRSEEEFSEGNIKPGTYNIIVRETNNPDPRYVNVLYGRYARANITVSKTGDITLNNIKYYTNSNVEIVDPETRALLEETVYATIDKSDRVQKITFIVENPVTLKFSVHKVDLIGNGLEGATFNINKYVGDSNEVAKGMTSVDTDSDGVITFEDGDYMKAGIYRYEITELKPAAEKYVNILDCYDDGSSYKVAIYIKMNLNGTTSFVKDAQGTPFTDGGRTPYTIINRNNPSAAIPDEVTEIVHRYLTVERTASRGDNPDTYDVEVTNTPKIDIDVIKVTKDSETNEEKSLTGTKFSAEADDGHGLFEDIPATQDKEYTFKNVSAGRHEFYLTESEGVPNEGYINVLEDRYVRVYTTVSADGVMKITDRLGNESPNYFEIYEGQYNDRAGSRLLDTIEYGKIYDCVSVEAVRQSNGVYKLNLKVNNPERNYIFKLNKKVFGEEDINMKDVKFFVRSTVDDQNHQLTTDADGNISFEEKRVPVGIYTYYVTETESSGPEFVNVLEDNYIAVALKVNQDGTIEIVDMAGQTEGNEHKYYILDARCTQLIDPSTTIVDDFVRVATNNSGEEPELDFFIKDPEKINFKLVKRDDLTNENLNDVTFTTSVYYQAADASSDPTDADRTQLVDANTFENIDISTIKTANIDGIDGVIVVPDILVDKTGTYTFVFHEESTDGLFKYLYKSHAEDITVKIDITVEKDNQGRPIGYKVGQPIAVTGAKYLDEESTLTTQTKAQTVRTEVLNTPIRGHYDLVLSKLDKYTSRKLDGAEFDIRAEKDGEAYELYEDVDDLRIENAIIPSHVTVQNGEIVIENIRITPPPYQAPEADGTLETFKIILTETKAPTGYMLLDDPIVLEVTTAIDGEYDDAEYVVKSVNLVSGDNHGLVTKTFGKNEINVVAKDEYFDLALRKSIVSVAYSDSEDSKITEEETEDRIPVIYEDDEIYDLNPSVTTANYRHVKNHVRVYPGQEVIYCLRVYNEGEIDGYAEEITDHLPEGLEFLATDKFNTDRGWTYDLNDQTLRTVKTTFLSKENNPNNDRFNAENNLIKAMDENVATGVEHELDFKEIEIKCRVSDNLRPGVILTNIAEISKYKAEDRTQETVDRDSVADNADVPDGKDLQNYKEDELTDNREDYVPGQEDDDDFEKLIVVEFDLALRKYITAINEEEVLADKKEAKYTDEVVEDTEDILGEGTASGNAEGTNEGANTNIVDESEGENGDTEGVDAETTGVNPDDDIAGGESDEEDIDDDNKIKYDREPRVNVSTLKSGDLDSIYKDPDEPTTALYNHTKAPVEVSVDDIVTYTLEIFNEGTVDGYATLIKDDIPEGVEFVPYEEGDGSVNDKYRWKMVDENDEEVTDPKDAKYIVSDYLSKDNETEENGNLIRAFNPTTGTRLDSKYVQVQFRVICKQDYPKLITNYAQISDDADDSGKGVKDRDSTTNEWIEGEDDQDVEHIWVTYMDLALRKFITGVTDFKTGKTEEITYRIPKVDPTALIDETGTTAVYDHTKEPVLVHTNDVVIYTLRIYNEGSKDGYATQIKDDLPEGLEFLPDHEINKLYEWSLVDKNDKPVTKLEDAEYAVTNYLSKDNETEERQNLIKSFDYYDYENDEPAKRETPEYKDIKIAFKVTEPQTSDRILINEAQISEQTDHKGIHREDRDSHPNLWLGEDDEDIEKVRVLYFDLALRKWVTKAIVTQNGEEKVFETGHHAEDDPEEVVKVDLKKSKINKVVVKFEYQIRITNEGEIDGYAKEIKDRIPEGLRFDPADNPTWTQLEENIIVTDELKDTLLKPGESAEVTVVLTWINSGDNLGLKVNVAEISKDYNDYGTHDIDSTPDNNVWGEDDIDDAPVMLAVKTGNAVYGYALLAVFVGSVLVVGMRRIKKINEG